MLNFGSDPDRQTGWRPAAQEVPTGLGGPMYRELRPGALGAVSAGA